MVYLQDEATRREINQWADEVTETESYVIAYQRPQSRDGGFADDHEACLTIWKKASAANVSAEEQAATNTGVLENVYRSWGEESTYEGKFHMMQSDKDVEAQHSIPE